MSDADYYECAECSYATNSPKRAANHETETGHSLVLLDAEE